MTEPSKKETQTTKQSDKVTKPAVLLTITALDTTWRFTPILIGTIIGIALDNALHTVVLWTIILLAVGAAAVVYLIYRQLKGVRS